MNTTSRRIFVVPAFLILFLFCITVASAQSPDSIPVSFNYNDPQTYTIADVTVSGVKYYTTEQILSLVSLSVGDTVMIPGDQLSQIARKLWAMRYFSDIAVTAPRVVGDKVYLNIHLL